MTCRLANKHGPSVQRLARATSNDALFDSCRYLTLGLSETFDMKEDRQSGGPKKRQKATKNDILRVAGHVPGDPSDGLRFGHLRWRAWGVRSGVSVPCRIADRSTGPGLGSHLADATSRLLAEPLAEVDELVVQRVAAELGVQDRRSSR